MILKSCDIDPRYATNLYGSNRGVVYFEVQLAGFFMYDEPKLKNFGKCTSRSKLKVLRGINNITSIGSGSYAQADYMPAHAYRMTLFR